MLAASFALAMNTESTAVAAGLSVSKAVNEAAHLVLKSVMTASDALWRASGVQC